MAVVHRYMAATSYQVQPTPAIEEELRNSSTSFDSLVKEAIGYLETADSTIDDLALARMYIERGYSEDFAHWLVREAEVRHAPG